MSYFNKIKVYTVIGAIALVSFTPASQAQIYQQQNTGVDTAGLLQILTGQPTVANNRTYYYSQREVVPQRVIYVDRNERRFCPPGQYKKGRCQDWRYKRKHHKSHNEEHGDRNHDWNRYDHR